jgi:anhydro-N-acetylmuramic acid kinase
MVDIYIGLMSGTSMDGVDGVLVDFSEPKLAVKHHLCAGLSAELKEQLLALNTPGSNELHRGALAANSLVQVYAQVVRDLLAASRLEPSQVDAIGAHGQTVRHQPGSGYTLQLNNPALLAELTGIDVVADFRSRDVAAGGQGAPLAPLFHQAVFAKPGRTLGVLNLGGIANLSVLQADTRLLGFDCGPANALMDGWCSQHTGKPWDAQGAWAASGRVLPALLDSLLAEPYFNLPPPKSTGRDLFHRDWLARHLQAFPPSAAVDVQATLAELTARSCAQAVLLHAPGCTELAVCGGGALNTHLMLRLQALLPALLVQSTQVWGLPPLQVEAVAFAWLARKAIRREAVALKSTTGARGTRVLGCIYPR